MTTPLNGLAAVLRPALGAQWHQLHPDIRARFTLASDDHGQSFTGVMDVVERTFMGWMVAKLIAFVRILPATRARNVPFEFNLRPADNNNPTTGWIKERLYRFADGVFEFRSVMSIANHGELIEQFPFGLGMKIKLSAEGTNDDTLYFRDDGYFLKLQLAGKAWRIPLPRLLTAGRFVLAHKNIDRERFTVEIALDHPLLGRLFYQYGEFREQPSVDAAMAAAIGSVPCRHPLNSVRITAQALD